MGLVQMDARQIMAMRLAGNSNRNTRLHKGGMPPLVRGHPPSPGWQLLLWEMQFLARHGQSGDDVIIAGTGPKQYASRLRDLAKMFPTLNFRVVDMEGISTDGVENLISEVRQFNGSEPPPLGRRLFISNITQSFAGLAYSSPESISELLKLHVGWCQSLHAAAALIPFHVPTGLLRFYDMPVLIPTFVKNGQRRIIWTPGDHDTRMFGPSLSSLPPFVVSDTPDGCGCPGCVRLQGVRAEVGEKFGGS